MGCPRAAKVTAPPEAPRGWEIPAGVSNSTAARSEEKGGPSPKYFNLQPTWYRLHPRGCTRKAAPRISHLWHWIWHLKYLHPLLSVGWNRFHFRLPVKPSLSSPGLPSTHVWSAVGVSTPLGFCRRSQSRREKVHAGFMPTLLQRWECGQHLIQQKKRCYNLSTNFQINLKDESQFVLNQHFASLACGILDPIPRVLVPDLLYWWTTTSAAVKQGKSGRERL